MLGIVTRPRQSPDAEFNYVHVSGCVITYSGDDGVVLDVAVTDVCIKRMPPSRGISVLWESQSYELTWSMSRTVSFHPANRLCRKYSRRVSIRCKPKRNL